MQTALSIQSLLQIGIVGVGLSIALEGIKKLTGTSGIKMKAITLGLALVVGSVYVFLANTPYWTTIISVLASASLVYAVLIPKGSSSSTEPAE